MRKWIVGIHPENQGFETRWADALATCGCEVRWLNLLAPDALDQARACHGIMWHFPHLPTPMRRAKTILHVIETELGIPVFPDLRTAWHFDDKVAQHYLLKAHDIPMPATWVFWRREEAQNWARSARYPVVLKLASGAGSQGVYLVQSQQEALRWIKLLFGRSGFIPKAYIPPKASRWRQMWCELRQVGLRLMSISSYLILGRYPPLPQVQWMPEKDYVLFQEFVPGNAFDTRVTVIGNRAFAFRRTNRPNDFRASGSGCFDTAPEQIEMACIRLAFATAMKLGMQSMACDILFDPAKQRHVITEISYAYVDWVVAKCPGYWDRDLKWHPGSMWPEEAHVEDFLARVENSAQRMP